MDVADGDNVTLLDAGKMQHKVRLTGIDAPEKAQSFGQRAKQNVSNWVFGKQVQVEADKLDRYGRTLGKVTVNGTGAAVDGTNPGLKPWIADWLGGRALELAFAVSINEDQSRGVGFRGAVPGPSCGPTRALLAIFQGHGRAGAPIFVAALHFLSLCVSPPSNAEPLYYKAAKTRLTKEKASCICKRLSQFGARKRTRTSTPFGTRT